MGSRQDYEEALAQRLALLRAELAGTAPRQQERRRAAERDEAVLDGTDEWGSEARSASPGRAISSGQPPEVPATPLDDLLEDTGATTLSIPGRHASRRFAAPAWLPQAALGPGPVAVVAVLLAVGLALTAWWALRSRPEPLPAAAPVAAGLATPLAAVGASSGATGPVPAGATPPSEVVVHVAGKVRRPGIVVLSPGARVIDALKAAGGARPGVDLTGVNLARVLVDGEQVLIGVGAPAAESGVAGPAGAVGPAGAGAAGGKINLNTASESELEELPGVGPVTAAAIVAFRTEHGPFSSVDELLDVSGIGEATLAQIAPQATV